MLPYISAILGMKYKKKHLLRDGFYNKKKNNPKCVLLHRLRVSEISDNITTTDIYLLGSTGFVNWY